MLKVRIIAVSLFVVSFSIRATVITSTACSVKAANGTVISATDPAACQVAAPSPSTDTAFASASGTEALPVTGSPSTATGISLSLATGTAGNPGGGTGSAHAAASDTLSLTTAGPLRIGKLLFNEEINLNGIVSVDTEGISVGSLHSDCQQNVPSTVLPCTGDFALPHLSGAGTVPFLLGQDFLFTLAATNDSAGGGSIPHFGSGTTNFSFTLVEADGVTPVQIFATPEPAVGGLVVIGLFLGLAHSKSLT